MKKLMKYDSNEDRIDVENIKHLSDTEQAEIIHCGTFKHVGGHKLLNACTFFFSWHMKKSKLPKNYLYRKGSFEGCGQFFPQPPPP